MPLQQLLAEETALEAPCSASNAGAYAAPASGYVHESNAANTAVPITTRYDAATVRQIIALAEQMQARHRETLSADELEALGREVGVAPEFVRLARTEVETKANAAAKTETKVKRKTQPFRAKRSIAVRPAAGSPLTAKQRELMVVPAALYFLLTAFTQNRVAVDTDAGFVAYFFAPLVVAFVAGFVARSKRVGALGGGLIGLALVGTLRNFVHYPAGMPAINDGAAAVAVIMAAGIIGAALNRWLGRARGMEKTPRRLSFILRHNKEA